MPFRTFVAVMGKSDVTLQPFQAPTAQCGTDIAVPARLECDLAECTDTDPATGIFEDEAVDSLIHNHS